MPLNLMQTMKLSCRPVALGAGLAMLGACAVTPPEMAEVPTSAEARAESYYQRGKQAAENRDLVSALSLFQTAADAGSTDAVYEIGIAYFEGRGVEIDHSEAFKSWMLGAEAGEPRSQYGLGYLYQQGQGVEQDTALAEQWYQAAAGRGHPKAKIALGRLAMASDDDVTAMQQFEEAAELGEAEALYLIGRLHEQGKGVDADPEKAMQLFEQAANAGDPKAQFRMARSALAEQSENGNSEENSNAAIEWLNKAAEQNHAEAQTILGKMSEDDDDRETAMSWYMRAALNGNETARERLADLMKVDTAKAQ